MWKGHFINLQFQGHTNPFLFCPCLVKNWIINDMFCCKYHNTTHVLLFSHHFCIPLTKHTRSNFSQISRGSFRITAYASWLSLYISKHCNDNCIKAGLFMLFSTLAFLDMPVTNIMSKLQESVWSSQFLKLLQIQNYKQPSVDLPLI